MFLVLSVDLVSPDNSVRLPVGTVLTLDNIRALESEYGFDSFPGIMCAHMRAVEMVQRSLAKPE
jgi:hypothetical protein